MRKYIINVSHSNGHCGRSNLAARRPGAHSNQFGRLHFWAAQGFLMARIFEHLNTTGLSISDWQKYMHNNISLAKLPWRREYKNA